MSPGNIPIYRNIDASLLRWPMSVGADDDTPDTDSDISKDEDIFDDEIEDDNYEEYDDSDITMGWVNREFANLTRTDWEDVKCALEYEIELFERIDTSNTEIDFNDAISDDEYEDSLMILDRLDIGVASAVMALSAAHCLTITSCNGSAGHAEEYPVVIFRCRPDWISQLIEAAEKAGCGLGNAGEGTVALFADDVHKMLHFAQELIQRRSAFDSLYVL